MLRQKGRAGVFVTLGLFSQTAREAATDTTPHVYLVDGEKLWELAERKGLDLRQTVILDTHGSTGSTEPSARTDSKLLSTHE